MIWGMLASTAASAISSAFTRGKKGLDADISQPYNQLNKQIDDQMEELPKENYVSTMTPIDERLSKLGSIFSTHSSDLTTALEESTKEMLRANYEIYSDIAESNAKLNKKLDTVNANLLNTVEAVKTYGSANIEAVAQSGQGGGILGALSDISSKVGEVLLTLPTLLAAAGSTLYEKIVNKIQKYVDKLNPTKDAFPEDPAVNEEYEAIEKEIQEDLEKAIAEEEEALEQKQSFEDYEKILKKNKINRTDMIQTIMAPSSEAAKIARSVATEGFTDDVKNLLTERGYEVSENQRENIANLLGILVDEATKEKQALTPAWTAYIEDGNAGLIPEGMTNKEFVDLWSSYNGIEDISRLKDLISSSNLSEEKWEEILKNLPKDISSAVEGLDWKKLVRENASKKSDTRIRAEDAQLGMEQIKSDAHQASFLATMAPGWATQDERGEYWIDEDSEMLKAFDYGGGLFGWGKKGNKSSDGYNQIVDDVNEYQKLMDKIEAGEQLTENEQLKLDTLEERYGFSSDTRSEAGQNLYNWYQNSMASIREKYNDESLQKLGFVDEEGNNADFFTFMKEWLKQWKIYETEGFQSTAGGTTQALYDALTNTYTDNPIRLFDPTGALVTDSDTLKGFSANVQKYYDEGYTIAQSGHEYKGLVGSGVWTSEENYSRAIMDQLLEVENMLGTQLTWEELNKAFNDILSTNVWGTQAVLEAVSLILGQRKDTQTVVINSNSSLFESD